MKSILSLFVLLLAFTFVHSQLICDVQYGSPIMQGGVLKGTMKFVQTKPAKLFFNYPVPTDGPVEQRRKYALTEFYDFNWQNGWDSASLAPYASQTIFRTGSACACETALPSYGAPILMADEASAATQLANNYKKTGTDAAGCTVYEANTGKITFGAKKVSFDKNNNPCSATIDGKNYKFSNCRRDNSVTRNDPAFTIPSGCKCGKPIDIALVLDRSGSISRTEWNSQREFIYGFAKQWEYDPLKANLAVINFQGKAWTVLKLSEGITEANVLAGFSRMGCANKGFPECDGSSNKECSKAGDENCCCCCGTCISCGMEAAGKELATSTRLYTYKLIITLTDGYQNHIRSGAGCGDDFNNLGICNQDIVDTITETKKLLKAAKHDPNKIAYYAIGVGSDRDVSLNQLAYVANGDTTRVLIRASFEELARNNLELVQLACQVEQKGCGDNCCGECICGQCNPVDVCVPVNPCNITVRNGFCCKPETVENSCAQEKQSNKCVDWKCDNTIGKCVASNPKTCEQKNIECFNVTCEPSTGLCVTRDQPGKTCKQCDMPKDCATNDKCANVECVKSQCVTSLKNCTKEVNPDKCHYAKCVDSQTGCQAVENPPCDDNDVCTTDVCDPDKGCTFTPIVCDDADPCTENQCDPVRGCIFPPITCNALGNLSNSLNVSNVTNGCTTYYCNKTDGVCVANSICNPPIDYTEQTVLFASLGAAALAGIIIAAVVLLAGASAGGAYAYNQASGPDVGAGAINNPMYKASGLQGENPLFRA